MTRPTLPSGLFLCLASLLLSTLSSVQAGWILQGTQQEGAEPPRVQTTTMAAAGLRVESPGQLLIFQPEAKRMIVADTTKKTYQVFDRAKLREMTSQMGAAMQQMQEAMAGMTPEQKALMEKMMGGQGLPGTPPAPAATPGTAPQPVTTYKKLADNVTVGTWTTDHYEVTVNGVKESEIWVAPLTALPIERDLIKLFTQMGEFFKDLFAGLPMAPAAKEEPWSLELTGDGAPAGIPVKELLFQDGRQVSSWEITSAKKADVDPALFALPAGFTEEKLPTPGAE